MFKPSAFGKKEISSYRVEYRIAGQENWMAVHTSDKQETFTVTGLRPNTEYQFCYAAVSKPGLSESSIMSDPVKTLPPTSPPGKPVTATVDSSAVTLTWQSPSVTGDGVSIREYKVEYKEEAGGESHEGKDKWLERRTGKRTEFCTIGGLRPRTSYRFRVSVVCADGTVSDPGEEVSISTSGEELRTLAQDFFKKSTRIEKGQPSVYALPIEEAVFISNAKHPKYRLGKENLQIPNKVIMVLGATGSGKTTLINGMINYILGVQWEDEFRFKLIHETTNRSQAQSQTSEVTAYEVHYKEGFQVPYSLTIIDTPGFGDTRGIEQDKEITRQIREFFSTRGAIDHIDAVCVVVQASLARLTHAQKYVFDSVLSIFGKDIKDNIQILITFADGQTPPVLKAINTTVVPCAKDAKGNPIHFKFNNSALFACNAGADEGSFNFDEMFWKMGAMSMKTFFESLFKLETRSLTLTQEVLREQKGLEPAVEGLQSQIKAGLVKLEELRQTQQALEQHRGDMEANKDFEYEVEKTVPVKLEVTKDYLTNCQTCHYTCHCPCGIADDKMKNVCIAMDKSGFCTVCPGKCQWNVHFNQKYRWDYIVVKEKQTYTQLKEKYEKASGEVMTTEKIFEQLLLDYTDVEDIVLELIERSSCSLQRLQEIALKPNPLFTPEYTDLMIMSEEQEVKPGYQGRIKSLREVREQAVLITKITNKEELLPAEKEEYRKHETQEMGIMKVCKEIKKGCNMVTYWLSGGRKHAVNPLTPET
uniref:Fibronectin type-III domain-containing protein n=2 Tax=Terrapene triunguis TaxID=2587831 RepID=A0A674I9N1_9SAUR